MFSRDKYMRLRRMRIKVTFEDGRIAILVSPERLRWLTLRVRFGWALILLGGLLMFGNANSWRTVIGPHKQLEEWEWNGGMHDA